MRSDSELVGRARMGDVQAFGDLVARHHPALYRTALAIVRSSTDAEDVTQTAWLQAYRHLQRFQGTATVRTWLISIVKHRAIDHRRSTRRRWRRDAVAVDNVGQGGVPETPEETLLRKERSVRLARSLAVLPTRLRRVLRLWHSGQYTYEQIARIARVPAGTIKSRVWEARRRVTATCVASDHRGRRPTDDHGDCLAVHLAGSAPTSADVFSGSAVRAIARVFANDDDDRPGVD